MGVCGSVGHSYVFIGTSHIWNFHCHQLLSNSAEFDCCESDQDASYSVTISHLLFTNGLALSYKVFYRKILRQLGKDSSYQLF